MHTECTPFVSVQSNLLFFFGDKKYVVEKSASLLRYPSNNN